jgi:undecaprenyl-diphosphatase
LAVFGESDMKAVQRQIARFRGIETKLLVTVLAIAGLLLVFGLIAEDVLEQSTPAFDRNIILWFRNPADLSDPIGPVWIEEAARDITALGSFSVLGILLFVVVSYLFLIGRRDAAWVMLVAVIGGVALNSLLKLGFNRPRPDLVAPTARIFTPSFPSGHAALSAITYLTIAALLGRTTPSRRLRLYVMCLAIILTFMVGVSRVYLGVHYPTDVLAGWCIGAAWALICWVAMTRLQQEGQVDPPQAS